MITSEKYYSEAKQIINEYKNPSIRPSFWFMKENHTFIKLTGKTVEEIRKHALDVAKENKYGMVCPVSILYGDKELRRVGECCHVDGNGNVNLDKWYNEIIQEDCIRLYAGE
jgi:hypothetical protein